MAKAEGWEEDDDFGDGPIQAVVGSATSTGESTEVSDMLLGLIAATTQLLVLLNESDEDEYNLLRGRLNQLRHLISQIPSEPPRRRKRVGFQMSPPRNVKRTSARKSPTRSRRNRRKKG